LSLLIRWAQRARCQAETPLIVLCRFPQPALWITIGYATIAARKHADRVGERKAFQHILAEQRIMPPLDKAAVSHLERVMARLPDVLKWRETLTEHQRIAWATPRSIINHCPIFKIEKERRRAVAPRKATRLENALEENAALKIEVESYRRVGDFEFSSQDRAADIAGLLCRGLNEHKQRAVMKELVRKLGTAKQREAFGLEDDDQPASLPAANGAAAQ
jgi:hypothetical protein